MVGSYSYIIYALRDRISLLSVYVLSGMTNSISGPDVSLPQLYHRAEAAFIHVSLLSTPVRYRFCDAAIGEGNHDSQNLYGRTTMHLAQKLILSLYLVYRVCKTEVNRIFQRFILF